ncbi:hypothetical protein MNBD_ALPHA09-467 [hydrothermal vent metagenome]|uniref:SPOR domain-containing protein n=1 Tax=hydrothermal vent metagenome TaxID=652676 RepID=A0A3B0TLA3_9ZZZZ
MTMYSESQSQFSQRHYPAQQEDVYAEDTERLYESFNDLYEDFDDGRSKTPFVIIGALLAIAIVGGGLAFAYKSGFQSTSAGGVPVVVADSEPAKVQPPEPGGMDIPHQGSLIFDRINGSEVEEAAKLPLDAGQTGTGQTTPNAPPLTIGDLAAQATDGARPNQPIAMADTPTSVGETLLSPAAPGGNGAGQPALPKPLLPPGAQAPVAALAPAPAGQAPGSPVLSPRKVETFTITPDGRIVSQLVDAAPAPAGGGLAVPSLPSVLEPTPPPAPANAPTMALAANQGAGQARAPSLPGGGTSALVPSPQPKPRPTTRDLAAVRQAQTPVATTSQPGLAGKFAVQVASNQRQADSLAIFADLKRRYPDLVGNYQPLIQRADLGSRGIYYRLRIGPLNSKADANRLCGSLRNAGLPGCIVRSL